MSDSEISKSNYICLHAHGTSSLLDGCIKTKDLVKRAKEMGMPAVALTDHGNLFGAVEFYKAAKAAGVKPIIGCEVYVSDDRLARGKDAENMPIQHLILLVKDSVGWKNLCNIVTSGYTEGFYRKPRTDKKVLEQNNLGLVCLSACFKGEVPQLLWADREAEAVRAALYYQNLFGAGNYFLELQNNGIAEQKILNDKLIALSRKTGIPVVATNDCHYLDADDAHAHDVLLCIQTGKTLADADRMKFGTRELYFKSPEEMSVFFADIPEAVTNTAAIAEMCNFDFELGSFKLPKFPLNGTVSADAKLTELAIKGLRDRFGGSEPPAEYSDRLQSELAMISKMGFPGYLLIVHDFIAYAKGTNIPVGPGRGSAAGSLVSYSIGITDIDPIRYGLLFERFLNPERISMPDIDVDFCRDRRQEVIEYVHGKYGKDHVSQIITFGTMAARSSLRDVGRAMGVSLVEVDKLAKLVPLEVKMTIDKALEVEPKFKEKYDNDPKIKELIDVARKLEGLSRHASTHAAGVVIAPEPITNFMPLYLDDKKEQSAFITQFDMKAIEDIGLLKFDFLGLKTLTIIDKTLGFLDDRGVELDIGTIPMDDEKTYRLLKAADTTSVFQLESSGMKDLLRKMQPDTFEDVIALVALFRPGPLGSGMVGDFVERKNGKQAVAYQWTEMAEVLDTILRPTYGVILYQEQVMQIANKISGFSLAQADILRKAMGKKNPEVMEKQKAGFVSGAEKNGYSLKAATELFDLMAKFAEYGFNKSHSAAYAYIAYQTAYLKAHYPVEFMAANLSAEMGVEDKFIPLINACRSAGVTLLPTDINKSGEAFRIEGDAIRLGLAAIKNVGEAAVYGLIAERDASEYSSFKDFFVRVKLTKMKVNKRSMENMIFAGVFDSFYPGKIPHIGRPALLQELECLLNPPKKPKKPKAAKQAKKVSADQCSGFFDEPVPELAQELEPETEAVQEPIPEQQRWDDDTLLSNEKAALGFYLSGHPVIQHRTRFRINGLKEIGAITEIEAESGSDMTRLQWKLGGVISDLKVKNKPDKTKYAYMQLEDESGVCEVLVPSVLFMKREASLVKGALVLVEGYSYGDGNTIKRLINKFLSFNILVQEVRFRQACLQGGG